MAHQNVGDAEVLPDLLDQIPADQEIVVIVGDGANDTRQCHAIDTSARWRQVLIATHTGRGLAQRRDQRLCLTQSA